jgi:hypothetical protein
LARWLSHVWSMQSPAVSPQTVVRDRAEPGCRSPMRIAACDLRHPKHFSPEDGSCSAATVGVSTQPRESGRVQEGEGGNSARVTLPAQMQRPPMLAITQSRHSVAFLQTAVALSLFPWRPNLPGSACCPRTRCSAAHAAASWLFTPNHSLTAVLRSHSRSFSPVSLPVLLRGSFHCLCRLHCRSVRSNGPSQTTTCRDGWAEAERGCTYGRCRPAAGGSAASCGFGQPRR